jgi:hypothetical protein
MGWILSLKLGTHCLGTVIYCYIILYKTDKLANLFSTPHEVVTLYILKVYRETSRVTTAGEADPCRQNFQPAGGKAQERFGFSLL